MQVLNLVIMQSLLKIKFAIWTQNIHKIPVIWKLYSNMHLHRRYVSRMKSYMHVDRIIRKGVLLTGLTSPDLFACPKQGPVFPKYFCVQLFDVRDGYSVC